MVKSQDKAPRCLCILAIARRLIGQKMSGDEPQGSHNETRSDLSVIEEQSETSFRRKSLRPLRRYTLDPDAPMRQFMAINGKTKTRPEAKLSALQEYSITSLDNVEAEQQYYENYTRTNKPKGFHPFANVIARLQKFRKSSPTGMSSEKDLAYNISKGRPSSRQSLRARPSSQRVGLPPNSHASRNKNKGPRSTKQSSTRVLLRKKTPTPTSGGRCSLFRVIAALSLCACIGGAAVLGITLGFNGQMAAESESSLRQFLFTLQVQEIDNNAAEWTSELKELDSPKAQNIIRALSPRIRSAFESEGLSTDSIYVNQIEPVNVAVYKIFNSTITSLTSDEEISLISSYEKESGKEIAEENKPRPQGDQTIIRVDFETSGKPSENAGMISQVGETEKEKIMLMLDKHLGNQGVIAKAESFAVSPEYLRSSKSVRKSGDTIASSPDKDGITGIAIDCFKSGDTLGLSRATLKCPPKCRGVKNGVIIGTDWYYVGSMICLAAIHNKVIENERGGTIDYMQSGNAFLFLGSTRNGVTSTSLFKFGRKFYLKKPGPSWTTTISPMTDPAFTGLQGERGILMTGHMTANSIDGNALAYSLSLSYSSTLKGQTTALMENKLFYSLNDMGFRVEKIKVSNFELEIATSALKLAFEVQGIFAKNTEALSPFMPLEKYKLNRLTATLATNLLKEGLGTSGISIEISDKFHDSWSDSGADDTVSDDDNVDLVCGCADVFFVIDTSAFRSNSDANNVLKMYTELFGLGNFDQFNIRFGIAVAQTFQSPHITLITDIGDLSTEDSITNLEMELMLAASGGADSPDSNSELWLDSFLEIGSHRFFTEDLLAREKLLVIYSETPLRRSIDEDVELFKYLKSKGMRILSIGYSRESEENSYEKYVSEPSQDFFKRVRNMENLNELSHYTIDVMRKYSCIERVEGVCSKPTDDSIVEGVNINNRIPQSSYSRGIPPGDGLKPYKVIGGLTIDGRLLPKTSPNKLTEPDEKQAFYSMYECGKSSVPSATSFQGKIVGGSAAMPHTWPWIVSINRLRSRHDTLTDKVVFTYNFWVCGGTIISSEWVITAAHCFAKGNERRYTTSYKILTGAHDQDMLNQISSKDVYDIRRILYYPRYDDDLSKFDVALLRTNRPITFRREISPACLPNPDVIPAIGKFCVVAGWGYTSTEGDTPRNVLKQAVQIVENPSRCQKVYRQLSYDPNYNMCSKRSVGNTVDMQCRGDSGGPLVCFENTRWVLYGVANYGPRDCNKGGNGVYMLVPSVMEWICCFVSANLVPCTHTICNTKLA